MKQSTTNISMLMQKEGREINGIGSMLNLLWPKTKTGRTQSGKMIVQKRHKMKLRNQDWLRITTW